MSELLITGTTAKNNLEELRKSISEKWESSGFLDGLYSPKITSTLHEPSSSFHFGKLPDNVFTREVLLEKIGHMTKTERAERYGAFPMVKESLLKRLQTNLSLFSRYHRQQGRCSTRII